MGWISERNMRTGCALYSQGPRRKGPLKRIKIVLHGDYGTNLFGSNVVLLECGHTSRSYGGNKAICEKCKNNMPVDDMKDYGWESPTSVPPAEAYQKNFTPKELSSFSKQ